MLPYIIKSSIKSLYKEKWINLLSIFTVTTSLLIITLVAFVLYNVKIASDQLPERFSIIAYLKDNLSQEDEQRIINTLKSRNEIEGVRLVSKEDAMKNLKETMKEASYILEGLDENPLSESIEIRIKKNFVSSSSVKSISEDLKKISGIEDVYYAEKVAEAIYTLKASLQNMSIIIFAAISAGVIFVIYSTVKILFYRRKEEIEIIKLLGATKGFIRMPFLIEGGIIGFLGGVLAIVGILLFYFAVTYRLSIVIPVLKALAFPVEILFFLPAIGIVLGILGSVIALGRLRL